MKNKQKQKHLPRTNTEFHGNKQKQRHGIKKHIFQSRMRERRCKYAVRKGPLRQAQGPGFMYGQ